MKKSLIITLIFTFIVLTSCTYSPPVHIAATTLPVYEFTSFLCENTGLSVSLLVTENVSCLHDYSLQVSQMRILESAEVIVMSGAGLEDFLSDIIQKKENLIDASSGVELICESNLHADDKPLIGMDHIEEHSHSNDPHIWLSPINAVIMAENICQGLSAIYPHHKQEFHSNLVSLQERLLDLYQYGKEELSEIDCRELITFHDGFSYFAEAFDLTILKAIEEESGSEASAEELIDLANLISKHNLPAIFTEKNGSASAAYVISVETNTPCFSLNMGLSGEGYFESMYSNISTIKEAMG